MGRAGNNASTATAGGGDSLRAFCLLDAEFSGADNGLSYHDRPLTNWWVFIGDFDYTVQRKMTLVEGRRSE